MVKLNENKFLKRAAWMAGLGVALLFLAVVEILTLLDRLDFRNRVDVDVAGMQAVIAAEVADANDKAKMIARFFNASERVRREEFKRMQFMSNTTSSGAATVATGYIDGTWPGAESFFQVRGRPVRTLTSDLVRPEVASLGPDNTISPGVPFDFDGFSQFANHTLLTLYQPAFRDAAETADQSVNRAFAVLDLQVLAERARDAAPRSPSVRLRSTTRIWMQRYKVTSDPYQTPGRPGWWNGTSTA